MGRGRHQGEGSPVPLSPCPPVPCPGMHLPGPQPVPSRAETLEQEKKLSQGTDAGLFWWQDRAGQRQRARDARRPLGGEAGVRPTRSRVSQASGGLGLSSGGRCTGSCSWRKGGALRMPGPWSQLASVRLPSHTVGPGMPGGPGVCHASSLGPSRRLDAVGGCPECRHPGPAGQTCSALGGTSLCSDVVVPFTMEHPEFRPPLPHVSHRLPP